MADASKRRSENIAGEAFVDTTCIDCETCRWIAPNFFKEDSGQSIVYHQPETEQDFRNVAHAIVSCPTASIGLSNANPELLKAAAADFPTSIADNVYYCGYHSEKSYGAASYFIVRKEGNILVDSPRFTKPLVERLHALGGIDYMYLTHRDDVADHEKFQKEFGLKRILHRDDVTSGTRTIEIIIENQDEFKLGADCLIIPVPGHTEGHTVLLYRDKFLFTGDHLAFSSKRKHLVAFRNACWYSWKAQTQSMERLLDYSFELVLPGHGGRYAASKARMKEAVADCVNWMKAYG